MANTFSTTGSVLHSQTIIGLANGTSHDYYVRCQDESNNTTISDYPISFSVANPPPLPPLPPSRFSGSPFGILRLGTTHSRLSLSTDETATCKYSTSPNTSYASMPNTFSSTNSTSHSHIVEGLTEGISYSYYVRCQGSTNAANSDDYIISFLVDREALPANTVPPIRSNPSPSGTLPAETTQTILAISTSEKAICKYSTIPNMSYPLMLGFLSTADSLFHSQTLRDVFKGQSYVYYVRCQDVALNINVEDYIISFSVASPPLIASSGGDGSSDSTPPSKVSNLTFGATETQTFLSWKNPADGDYQKTKILRKENFYPSSPFDGFLIFDDNKNSFIDTDLKPGIHYFYSVFAYDNSGNFSQAATVAKGASLGSSYPDSTLLKTPDSIKIYAIIQGKKKWISTPEVFETLGYKRTSINIVDANTLNSISDFEDNLIRANGDIKVYMVVNNIRHHIPSPEIFLNYGFFWSDVKDVPQAAIDQYRAVKLVRESGQSMIYYLSSSGIKKWILSPEIFDSYGNSWFDIQIVSKKEMESYPASNLIKLIGSSDINLIEGTVKRLISSSAVFDKYQFDWNKVLEVNQAEFDWYATVSVLK